MTDWGDKFVDAMEGLARAVKREAPKAPEYESRSPGKLPIDLLVSVELHERLSRATPEGRTISDAVVGILEQWCGDIPPREIRTVLPTEPE
jgi:hypothetical protein